MARCVREGCRVLEKAIEHLKNLERGIKASGTNVSDLFIPTKRHVACIECRPSAHIGCELHKQRLGADELSFCLLGLAASRAPGPRMNGSTWQARMPM